MVRCMCGVSMKDKKTSSMLRWYGHVIRKYDEDWVKTCMEIRVYGRRLVGIPIRTWLEGVEADIAKLEIDRKDGHDRKKWRRNVMKRSSALSKS